MAGEFQGTVLVLSVGDDAHIALSASRELKLIRERLRGRGADKLRFYPLVGPGEFIELLQDHRDARVVHFIGHGTPAGVFEATGSSDWEEALPTIFAQFEGVQCVVLNTSYSAELARRLTAYVPWVIGMNADVTDTMAAGFVGAFYDRLFEGSSVERAFELARAWVQVEHPELGDVPQVFGHSAPVAKPGGDLSLEKIPAALARLGKKVAQHTLAGEDTAPLRQQLIQWRRALHGASILEADSVLAGRYRVRELIGTGAFAQVWKAWDQRARELVAVKVLHAQFSDARSRRERFASGVEAMNQLDHPGLVKVLDGPLADGARYFYVLPWYPGLDLRSARQGSRHDSLSRDQALLALLCVLEGLAHAHAQGLVHRDVKPSNVLLDERGRGALSDFDLALVPDMTLGTRTAALGTFVYAAPEQLRDASRVGPEVDVYSAAMTMVFALMGEDPPPLLIKTEPELLDALPCSLRLRAALRAALAYEPEARTITIGELAEALRLELRPELAAPPDPEWLDWADNAHEWARLTTAIDLSEDFALLLVLVPSRKSELGLSAELGRLEDSRHYRRLNALDASPFPAARLSRPDQQPSLTLLQTTEASASRPEHLERCLVQLNGLRDAIATRCRGPLVISLRPDALSAFEALAPDLLSVYRGEFHLSWPPVPLVAPAWLLPRIEALAQLGLAPLALSASDQSASSDPSVELVSTLRALTSVPRSERAAQQALERSLERLDESSVVRHFAWSGLAWLHLRHHRRDLAERALDEVEASARAWGSPDALLRAELLRLELAYALGDLHRAQERLECEHLLERARELYGEFDPATLDLLARAVELLDGLADPDSARVHANACWRALEYVSTSSPAILDTLIRFARRYGPSSRLSSLLERWAEDDSGRPAPTLDRA